MREKSGSIVAVLASTIAVAVAGCGAGGTTTSASSSTSASSAASASASASVHPAPAAGTAAGTTPAIPTPSVYGEPVAPSSDQPREVATDAPMTAVAPSGSGVSVVLTYFGWNPATAQVEVDGYVPGVLEAGGTCTLTLTQGANAVTASVPGTPNVSDTDCGGAAVPRDQLAPGAWSAVLSYRSATADGSSTPVEVTVP